MRQLPAILVALLLRVACATSQGSTVAPVTYELTISLLKAEESKFSGEIKVSFNVLQDVTQLRLDLDPNIQFTDVQVYDVDDSLTANTKAEADSSNKQLLVTLPNALVKGNHHSLSAKFEGSLTAIKASQENAGPYGVKDRNGVWWYGVLPGSGSKTFPCWDDPSLRSRFQLKIHRKKEQVALANGALERSVQTSDGYEDIFEATPPMSASEFQFIVSEALKDKIRQEDSNGRDVTLWGQTSAALAVDSALRQTASWTGASFTPSKLDVVVESSAPELHSAAWGLAVVGSDTLSIAAREQATLRIANVALRQWFGGELSPASEEDDWLFRALHTHLEFAVAALVEPSWDLRSRQRSAERRAQGAEAAGVLPADIRGAALLSMLEGAAGEGVFQEAVRQWVVQGQMSSAAASRLWSLLQQGGRTAGSLPADLDLQAAVTSWLEQPGLPVISVLRNYGTGDASISQQRFRLIDQGSSAQAAQAAGWWVPVRWTRGGEGGEGITTDSTTSWISPDQSVLGLNDKTGILTVDGEAGFYLVNYDLTNWGRLVSAAPSLPERTRARLVWDSQLLARAGQLEYSIALELLRPLRTETSLAVWEAAEAHIAYLERRLSKTTAIQSLKDFSIRAVERLYASLRLSVAASDSHARRLLRALAVALACWAGDKSCAQDTTQLLAQQLAGTATIPADITEEVFCWGVFHSLANWEALYASSTIPEEQALRALVCTGAPTKQTQLLERLLSSTTISQDQSGEILLSVAAFPDAYDTVFTFVSDRYKDIADRTGGQTIPARLLVMLAAGASSETALNKVKEILERERTSLGTAAQVVEDAVKEATQGLSWYSNNYDKIKDWIEAANKEPIKDVTTAVPTVPTTHVPTTHVPRTTRPATRHTPVTQPPITLPPVTQRPVTQPPVTQRPVTQRPVTQRPVTQPPVTRAPGPRPADRTTRRTPSSAGSHPVLCLPLLAIVVAVLTCTL